MNKKWLIVICGFGFLFGLVLGVLFAPQPEVKVEKYRPDLMCLEERKV